MSEGSAEPGLPTVVALYASARIGLVAIVAAVLALLGVPLIIAVLVALIVALPLSMVLFVGLRRRVEAALAVTRRRRAGERDALRARLRGDDGSAAPASADDAAEGETDRGRH